MQFAVTSNQNNDPYLFWKKFIESELCIHTSDLNNLNFINYAYESICTPQYLQSNIKRINNRILFKYYEYDVCKSEHLKAHFGIILGMASIVFQKEVNGRIIIKDKLVVFCVWL